MSLQLVHINETSSKNKNIYKLCTLLFIIRIFADNFAEYQIIVYMLNISTYFSILLLLTINANRIYKIKLSFYNIILTISLLLVLFDSYSIKVGEYGYILEYIPIIIFAVIMLKNNEWIDTGLSIMWKLSFIFVFGTYFCYFFKDFYLKYIINLFPSSYSMLIDMFNSGYVAGFANHYSLNAIYIVIALGLAIAYALCNYSGRMLLISFIIFVALLLTGKRGALLFVIPTLGIVYFLFLSNKPKSRLIKISMAIFLAFVVGIIVISIFHLAVFDRFIYSDDTTLSGRTYLYNYAWNLFLNNKFFGIGWGYFKHLNSNIPGLAQGTMLDVHDVYLQLLCETGIVGFSIFIVLFVSMYYKCIKVYIFMRKYDIANKFLFPLTFALYIETFFLLYCFSGNPLYDLPMLYPYMISICIVEMVSRYIIKMKKEYTAPRCQDTI